MCPLREQLQPLFCPVCL